MSKLIKIFTLCVLFFTSNQVLAGEAILVMTVDAKGDVDGCVAMNKEFNELAMKLVPDNHPDVKIIHATYAGPDSGVVWVVVEFDDLADMARVTAVLDASKEASAMQKKMDRRCPVVSTAIGSQLYHNSGT